MALIKITGQFLDVAGRPLNGTVRIEPVPIFIAESETTIYAAPVTAPLDSEGNLDVSVLATDEWRYRAKFDLRNVNGARAELSSVLFDAPEETTVGKILASSYSSASAEPVITFATGPEGEVIVTGGQIDPSDPGAILLPIT